MDQKQIIELLRAEVVELKTFNEQLFEAIRRDPPMFKIELREDLESEPFFTWSVPLEQAVAFKAPEAMERTKRIEQFLNALEKRTE